ncbi:hypothetical protein L2E82_10188 [Cichorium intybus]|uniref:Uncharacterized protein n=1 Tax=Cichorium intybus TaxID=13427 RepID=A0ACB9G9T5_CICIN|nr:hypothetical protein L2E82_10188 [Cichorium intybus]
MERCGILVVAVVEGGGVRLRHSSGGRRLWWSDGGALREMVKKTIGSGQGGGAYERDGLQIQDVWMDERHPGNPVCNIDK